MANKKITDLTEDTAPTSSDFTVIVDDIGGTPTSKKASLANVVTKAHGLSDGIVKVASGAMTNASQGTDYYAPSGTDVAVADGGTGASTPADARQNLGLVIGTDVQPQGATLTSLEGLSLAQGDILYATGADTLQRLPKGVAGQELRMNAGATAPEWYTPTTGGAYKPKIRFHYSGAGIADNGAYGGISQHDTNAVGGAQVLYQASGSIRLVSGNLTGSTANNLLREQTTIKPGSNVGLVFWDKDIYSGLNMTTNINVANFYGDTYIGIGDINGGLSTVTTNGIKCVGLWIEARNTTIKYYIHTNNGTTSTKTEITSAVNAISLVPNLTTLNTYADAIALEFIAGTSFKIYINGSNVGTVTTNLPSGATSDTGGFFGGTLLETTTNNSISRTVSLTGGFIEWTLY